MKWARLPRPACGERSDCIVRCDPGEGVQVFLRSNPWREPFTPALSPQERGEGEKRSGGPNRVEEFAHLDLEAVAVAGQ